MKTDSTDMCSGPILKKIIPYTLPIMATGILQLLFNAADLIVVGRYCGSVCIAAVGATSSLVHLIINLFMGLSVGSGVAVAHAIGARDDKAVSNTVHTAIPVALISGVLITVIGISFADSMLELMDTPDNVLELSSVYLRIYFAGITACLLYNFGAAILRAAGDTKGPLLFLTLAGVINVILNYIFVAGFGMDVDGVALATTISQTISAVLVVIALMRRTDACRLVLKKMRIHALQLKKILLIGIPAGVQSSLFSISNVLIQSSVNSFGDIAMSGSAAAANIEGFVYTVINSFSHSALNFTGQNAGAKKYDRVRRVLWVCLCCAAVSGLVAGSLVYIFAKPLLSIYITDSAEAIGCGITRITYICLPYLFCGLMEVTTASIRGMGSSIPPMFTTIIGICGVRILWVLFLFPLPQFHSLESLFLSYPLSWIATFIVQMLTYFIVYRIKTKPKVMAAV